MTTELVGIYWTLAVDGWWGRSLTRVEVVGQTKKRLRIRAIERTRMAGRDRWLESGETALVPTYAVRDNCVECKGCKGGVPGNENRINGRGLCDYCHAAQMHKSSGERKP